MFKQKISPIVSGRIFFCCDVRDRAGTNHPEPFYRGPTGVKGPQHGLEGPDIVVRGPLCRCKGPKGDTEKELGKGAYTDEIVRRRVTTKKVARNIKKFMFFEGRGGSYRLAPALLHCVIMSIVMIRMRIGLLFVVFLARPFYI